MKAELYKRLFKAIYTEDIVSLKKIAITIIQEERKLGHNVLADSLEKLTITEKPKYTLFDSRRNETGLASLPKSKRNNSQLVSYIPREQLKHHMVLPEGVEERLLSIEQEYAARERLKRYNYLIALPEQNKKQMNITPSESKNGKRILMKLISNGTSLKWNEKRRFKALSMLIMVKLWKCLMALQKYVIYQTVSLPD